MVVVTWHTGAPGPLSECQTEGKGHFTHLVRYPQLGRCVCGCGRSKASHHSNTAFLVYHELCVCGDEQ